MNLYCQDSTQNPNINTHYITIDHIDDPLVGVAEIKVNGKDMVVSSYEENTIYFSLPELNDFIRVMKVFT